MTMPNNPPAPEKAPVPPSGYVLVTEGVVQEGDYCLWIPYDDEDQKGRRPEWKIARDYQWGSPVSEMFGVLRPPQHAPSEREEELRRGKNQAYEERNRLVALLACLFPSGRARTAIEGWSEDWHGCVYIDFPWGQASWHFHDSHAHLFEHLPQYDGCWNGHTTEEKYAAIAEACRIGVEPSEREAYLERLLWDIIERYDGYRMRRLYSAPEEYAAMVQAINEARYFLQPEDETKALEREGEVTG